MYHLRKEKKMEVVIPEHNIGVRIDMNQCLLDIKSYMESILCKWAMLSSIGNGEGDGISFCMLQMMVCKLNSFVTIANNKMITGSVLLIIFRE